EVVSDARRAWSVASAAWSPQQAPVIPEALELGREHTREDARALITLPGAWSGEQLAALRALARAERGLSEREEAFLRDRFAGDLTQRRPDCAGWAKALIALSMEEVASLVELSQTLVGDAGCRAAARDVFVPWALAGPGSGWQAERRDAHRELLERLAVSDDRRARAAAARALFISLRSPQR
ncbi:MAG: hypothetical protein AAGI01_17255, partial [Myxococcota bacterium]